MRWPLVVILVASCRGEGTPQAKGAALARDGEQSILVLADEMNHGRASFDSRLVAIDARTGKQLASRTLDPRVTLCASDAAGRLWCDIDGKMRGVNARTLADQAHTGEPPPTPSYVMPPNCNEAPEIVKRLEGTCQLAATVGDLVVVALDDQKTRAVGLDAATGAERWRVPR